jgi:hypothetical protein
MSSKQDDTIVMDPNILGGMPVIKGTRVLVYDLAASVKAGVPRDRILATYSTIWIWLSLTPRPIHCSGGPAGCHHGQVQLW